MSSVLQIENDNKSMKSNIKRVSAYSFFQKDSDRRTKVMESLGDEASFGDISKGMSKVWKNLSVDDKAKYVELSVNSKDTTRVRKRARSSYTLFTMNSDVKSLIREEHPDVQFSEFSKYLSIKWKSMSDEDKKPYSEASDKEKSEFKSDKSELKPVKESKRKRARTAYVFYVSDVKVRGLVKESNPDADFGALSKLLAKQWKEILVEDKAIYEKLSKDECDLMLKDNVVVKTTKPRRRARTAYTFYTMNDDVRAKLKSEHQDAKFSEFSKILSKQWNVLNECDKQCYVDQSMKEKSEMATLVNNKKPKQKRGRSAYTLYSSDKEVRTAVTGSNPEASFGGISKILSKQWKELSEELKLPYIAQSDLEKKKTAAEKEAAKPPKTRAKSAYLHYSMDPTIRDKARGTNPNLGVTELAKILGKQWRTLNDDEKVPYQNAYETEKSELTIVN
jgi:predicted RNase H-like nuclease